MATAPFNSAQIQIIDRYSTSGYRLVCCKGDKHRMGKATEAGVRCETCGNLHTVVPDRVFAAVANAVYPHIFRAEGVH